MAEHDLIQDVSLEALCAEQKQPFVHLARGGDAPARTGMALGALPTVAFRAAKMHCGRVCDVTIFGKSYVSDRPGRAVFSNQSHRNYHKQEFLGYYADEILNEARARPTIAEECCFIGGFAGKDRFFGHFVFEYLYRLVAFEMGGALLGQRLLGRLPLVVYENIPEAWLSFIELFGVPKSMILRVPQSPAPHFASVWVAACPNYATADGQGYAFWDDGVLTLHTILRAKALAGAPPGPKRIFLGRRGARHRRLCNEDEVWRYLEDEGFVYPDFEGKSAAEQIRLVGSAETVVSVGGSGSVMTHFAPKTCTIIEILQPHLTGGLGSWGFATVLGQTFGRVPAQAAVDGGEAGLENDMTVDIEILRKYVNAALKQGA